MIFIPFSNGFVSNIFLEFFLANSVLKCYNWNYAFAGIPTVCPISVLLRRTVVTCTSIWFLFMVLPTLNDILAGLRVDPCY